MLLLLFVCCDGTNFSYITQASLTHNNTPDIVSTKNTRFIKNFSSPLYADSSLFNHGVPQFYILHNILFGIPLNMPSHLRQSFFMKIGSTILTPTWLIMKLGSDIAKVSDIATTAIGQKQTGLRLRPFGLQNGR